MTPKKHNRDSFVSLDWYESILEAVNYIVWEWDGTTLNPIYTNDAFKRMLGYDPQENPTAPLSWMEHIHPEDRNTVTGFYREPQYLTDNNNLIYRMVRVDETILWVKSIISLGREKGSVRWLRGIVIDITETKLLQELEHLELKVLQLNALKQATTEELLRFYVSGIEQLFPEMKCSIMRVNGDKLNHWASGSLPPALTTVRDEKIGPFAGSCGAAAYLKQKVIVSDIANSPIWESHKHLLLPFGLRASWSYPIINGNGDVIATFGIYLQKIALPEKNQTAIIERSTELLRIIIENRLYEEMAQDANLSMMQGQELANFGIWQWDIVTNQLTLSDVLYSIYGVDKNNRSPTYEGYLELLHPDDRTRISSIIQHTLATGSDCVFHERIICPDNRIKHLKSWIRVIPDVEGKPKKIIGACLDITEAEATKNKMEEIAWLQSHVIRSPLARLMGLVNMLRQDFKYTPEHTDLLNKISQTADELDDVIRSISANTQP